MLICDTSALLAFFAPRYPEHPRVSSVVQGEHGPLVVSPYVIAELDYLLLDRGGVRAELPVLAELSSGAWELASFGGPDLILAASVMERYSDQEIGLADASLVVLAARYDTNRILTLDQRHFRVLKTLDGEPFELLP